MIKIVVIAVGIVLAYWIRTLLNAAESDCKRDEQAALKVLIKDFSEH